MGTRNRAVGLHLTSWLAVLAALTYFFLATYRIDLQSIWYDEGLTLHYSSLPLVDGLRELASQSVHPPLYFAGLHFWLKVAGDSDFALRFPSAALGALLVSASFLLGSKLADRWLGAIVAFVMATSPFLVYYGQEARMYTAVALLSTLVAAGAIGVVRRGRGYLTCIVASSLAVLTHYFAFLGLGSLVVIVFPILALQRRYRDLAKWLGSLAVACLVFLPWAANLLRVAATHDDFWRDRLSFAGMLQDAVLHFSLGEVAWPDNDLMGIFYVALALGLLGLVRRRLRLAVLTSVATLIVSFLALVAFPKATYVARYVLVVAPAYYLLVAAGIYNLATMLIIRRSNGGGKANPGLPDGPDFPAKASTSSTARQDVEALAGRDNLAGRRGLPASGRNPLPLAGKSAMSQEASPFRVLTQPEGLVPRRTKGGLRVLQRAGFAISPFLAVVLVVLLGGANIVSLLHLYFDLASFRREDFKSLAKYLEPLQRPGDAFVFVAGPLNYALFHYLPESAPAAWVDADVRLRPGDPLPRVDGLLAREDVKRIWLVRSLVSADDLVDPDRVSQNKVMERFGVMTALKDVRGLIVEGYDRELYDQYRKGTQVDIKYGDEVSLPRFNLRSQRPVRGGKVEVELFWEPLRGVARLLWVSLQLVDGATGKMVALADFPAGGLAPTTTWKPGMRLADRAGLSIPKDAPAGDYDAYLIVYDPATGERLKVAGGLPGSSADAARLFSVKISD